MERVRLVRFCTHFTGNATAAEDLVQQTLLVAWQQRHMLHDPARRQSWLFGIARHRCLAWLRRHRRELAYRSEPMPFADPERDPVLALPDDVDLERELERAELAHLLDRALARLPPLTRAVLVARYIDEAPHAVIAAQLAITGGAVEARLHHGKRALRRVLATELQEEAAAYGLLGSEDAWHETRIWCTLCGRQRLRGRFTDDRALWLHCPTCNTTPGSSYHQGGSAAFFAGITGFKPALNRVLVALYATHHSPESRKQATCERCGQRLAWHLGSQAPTALLRHYLEATCRSCGAHATHTTWSASTLGMPEALRFWRDHQRIRPLPERCIEVAGAAAIVNGFESLTAPARLEIVALRDHGAVLGVYRS